MRPAPMTTVSSGLSVEWTATSHSCANNMSSPRSMLPPPVRNIPVSNMSCVNSGGASARQRRAVSAIERTVADIAWRTSSSVTLTSTVFPPASSRPVTTAAVPVELGNAEPIAILISSAAVSPIATPYRSRMWSWIAASRSNPPERDRAPAHDAAHRHDRHLGPSAPDVDDQVADRLVDRQASPDRGRERLLDERHVAPATGEPDGLLDRTLLHLGAHRRYRDQDARFGEARRDRTLHDDLEHALRDVELGHRTRAERANRDHVARVAADQVPHLVAHPEHPAGAAVKRDNRRLVEDDPVALSVDQRVRGTQIDREVTPHQLPMTQWASPETSDSFFQMGTSSFRPLDAVAARLERIAPMRRRARDHDAGLADSKVSRAVQDRHLADRPLLEELVGDLVQTCHGKLVPRLVSKPGHVPGLRMVSNGTDEHAGAPRAVVGDQGQRLVHGERIGRHANRSLRHHVNHSRNRVREVPVTTKLLISVAMGAFMTACTAATPTGAPISPGVSPGGASPSVAPRTPASIALPWLPPQGVVVQRNGGVVFVGVDGRVLARIHGLRLANPTEARGRSCSSEEADGGSSSTPQAPGSGRSSGQEPISSARPTGMRSISRPRRG